MLKAVEGELSAPAFRSAYYPHFLEAEGSGKLNTVVLRFAHRALDANITVPHFTRSVVSGSGRLNCRMLSVMTRNLIYMFIGERNHINSPYCWTIQFTLVLECISNIAPTVLH